MNIQQTFKQQYYSTKTSENKILTFFQICHRQMSLNTWPLPYDKPADKRGMVTPACLPHSVPTAHNMDKYPGIKWRHKNLKFYGIDPKQWNRNIRKMIKYYWKKTLAQMKHNYFITIKSKHLYRMH